MARFFNPSYTDESKLDNRLHAPATARNRAAIFDVMAPYLEGKSSVLEIASGTGEHAAHMAPKLPHITWQPSDLEARHIQSIDAWAAHSKACNIAPAIKLDILSTQKIDHSLAPYDMIAAINLIHIAPWDVCVALLEKARKLLDDGGCIFLYGPYMRGGHHTSPSNADFDISLKASNPAWGVRALEDVTTLARQHGFQEPIITEMPANNLSVIYQQQR